MGTESTASTAVESLPQQRSSEGRPLVGASAAPAAAGAPAPSFSGSPPWAASISHLLPDQDDDEGPAARTKRPRVALACQRCKARKQKCDGRQPCGKCAPSNVRCEYVVPQKPMPFGKNQYIKSLERRVAELETLLARQGVAEVGTDHWKMATPPPLGFGDSGPAGVPAPAAPRSASSVVQTEAGGGGGGGSSGSPTTTGGDAAGGVAAPAKHPDEAVLDWQDGLDSVVSVLRSLSLDMDGSGYIGASSHVALGRLFNFLSRGSHHPARDPSVGGTRRPSSSFQLGGGGGGTASVAAPTTTPSGATPPALAAAAAAAEPMEPIDFADVPSNLADRLYVGYIKNVMTRFPVVHSVWLRAVHHRRHALTDVFEATILHLVYATSGRFIETTGESGPYHARRHYAAAMRELDTMLEYNDIRTVQALMLMAIYCLRDPAGPGAWTCSRMALLVAIDHGLHRQTKAAAQTRCLESELRKRLFWACYCFDRQISIPMGRPLGISDRDIDIALPLDVDEDITEHALAVIDLPTRTRPADPSTSLTSFVLIAELRRIESTIQETIYRVDRNAAPIDDAVIDGFLERLEHWKAQIPHDTKIVRDIPGFPYDGYYFYMVFYYKVQRLLLYPVLSDCGVAPRFLKACAQACAGICGAYKRLHQTLAVGYSFMALQNVFIAGLTLVYCIWLCPSDIFDMTTSNGIHDCSIVLFVIAERVPAATKYRNAFELIRQKVIDQIIAPQAPDHHQPRAALAGLTNELAPSVQAFEVNMPFEVGNGSFEEFSQIITDMSGGESFVAGLSQFHAENSAGGGLCAGASGGGGVSMASAADSLFHHHHGHHSHHHHSSSLVSPTSLAYGGPVFGMADM